MLTKIKDIIRFIRYYLPALCDLMTCRDSCFLLVGTPLHGNIGDQAIVLGEEEYFARISPHSKLIEVPSRAFVGKEFFWRRIALRCNAVLLHGGGYLGTLWPDEDQMVRSCFKVFSDLPIIVLPQTLFFEKGSADRNVIVYREAISNCSEISICLRERESYELATECFGRENVILIPDMVLNLSSNSLGIKKADVCKSKNEIHVLLCLRRDKEKTIDEECVSAIKSAIKSILPGALIAQTDTVVDGRVTPSRRKDVVRRKVEEFQNADLVITDRLHGMVLAAISGTPTVALKSKSPKVEGVYGLSLSGLDNVQYCSSISQLSEMIESVIGKRYEYDPAAIRNEYDSLTRLIATYAKSDCIDNE